MANVATAAKQSDFVAQLEAANLHPLWDRFRTLTPVKPQAKDPPLIWRWRDIEPFTARAGAEVPINDVERRALILVNPAFGGETVTTSNLIGAFTVLDPGDRARPHRHTFAAIRFATQAEGATTIVNGRRCDMHDGDLDSDAADVLARPHQRQRSPHHLVRCRQHPADPQPRCQFLRARRPEIQSVLAGGRRRRETVGGVRPGRRRCGARAGHSPKYHYSGAATRRLLAALPAGDDGARTVRYTNPATGDAVMPALDCYAMRLPKGQATRPKRTTCNMICLVVSGLGPLDRGRAHVRLVAKHDVFSIPHWNFASHTAIGGDADLFIVSDRVRIRAPRSPARGIPINPRPTLAHRRHRRAGSPRRGRQIPARLGLLRRRHRTAGRIALRAGALAACACAHPADR